MKTNPDQSVAELPAEVRLQIARLEGRIRGYEHHEKRATDELDQAGIEKFDDGDGQGGEWSLWVRIARLRRERDALRNADAGRLVVERNRLLMRALAAEKALRAVRCALDKVALDEEQRDG